LWREGKKVVEFWGQHREGEAVPWLGAHNSGLAVVFFTGHLESLPPASSNGTNREDPWGWKLSPFLGCFYKLP